MFCFSYSVAVEIAGALLAGIAIGSVLGFVGAGGAMLTVPILVYGFSFAPAQALVASLAVVIVAALSGLYPRYKSGEILVKEALIIWAIGSFANVGAANLAKNLSESILITGFCAVIIFAGITMLQKPVQAGEKRIPLPVLVILALLIGLITGLFGIGGGFLAIPVLVLGFNVPQNKAAGTSLLIIVLNCATALLAHNSDWNKIDWQVPLLMGLSAIAIGNWAGKRSAKTNPVLLRKYFAYLLFSIAAFTLFETWFL
ncbi:MAG: hypothetical protein RL740_392 [Actinomycetota bacterium]